MSRIVLVLALVVPALAGAVRAQAPAAEEAPLPVDADERRAVVESIAAQLEARYVFPDVAAEAGERLLGQLEAGDFDDESAPEAFAERLTESLQAVTHDKHLRVRTQPPPRVEMLREHPARARLRQLEGMRRENYGFETVRRLEGNVGYLDLRFFAGAPEARETAAAAMNFLAHVDALIFDLRQNRGGSPEMIRYLSSWLFAEPTHLNSLYWREGDVTQEFWTLPEVPGPSLADVPVFVLTSSFTFSGGEEFCYNLRTRERATLIGETTGGGANPGGPVPVSNRFVVFIPTGRAINPITGTNWEGVGVEPHIAVLADEAYDVALEQAQAAAAEHRAEREAEAERRWAALEEAQQKSHDLAADGREAEAAATITAALQAARAAKLLGEMDINMLGYEHLQHGEIALAIAVFQFNVDTYPDSFNVYDSLGEAYMEKGDREEAIRLYRRSLELNPENANAAEMIRRMEAETDG